MCARSVLSNDVVRLPDPREMHLTCLASLSACTHVATSPRFLCDIAQLIGEYL
jgi:hypothetical protein